jgi:hypothetical protein
MEETGSKPGETQREISYVKQRAKGRGEERVETKCRCSSSAHHDATPLFFPLPAVEDMEPRLSINPTLGLGSAVQTGRKRRVHCDNPRKPPNS